MFRAARKHLQAIVTIGVASALVVGGVATAQGNSQNGPQGGQGKPQGEQGPSGHPAGPPPLGPLMQGLTYAELHIQKNGQEQVVRLDQGKIAAVDSSSITLTENDGSEVTVPLDESTKVMGKPGSETTVADLSVGQQVIVCGPAGGTAKSIQVLPKKGEAKGAPEGEGQGGQMPPPPGGPQGGQQGSGS
jgi:hypothetical protein